MLRRILGCFVVATLFWQLWPPLISQAQTAPTLFIGEVAWAGSPISNADEWLEIWNMGDERVSLAGYWLDGAGPDEGMLFDETSFIEAHSAFVIANYNNDHENAAYAMTPGLVSTALSLSNSSLHIFLIDPEGYVVDEAGDGSAPFAGSSTPKASMLRLAPVTDGTRPESWTTAIESQNFYADIESFGTPGICDGCMVATIAESTPVPDTEEIPPEETTPTSTTEILETVPPDTATSTEEQVSVATTTVPAPNPQFPEIKLQISGSFTAGEEITFDASSSSDPNGDIVYFTWNFGDETSATESKVTHTYASSGEYSLELIASDTTFRSFATTTLVIKPAPLPPPSVFLNEVHPAPSEGPEWVELFGLDHKNLSGLVGWTMEDSAGTIFRFTSSSIESIELQAPYAVVSLSSSKLNNSGDSVLLKRPDGSLADGLAYEATEKGMSWSRLPDKIGEWFAADATKLETNGSATVLEPEQTDPEIAVTKIKSEEGAAKIQGAVIQTASATPVTTSGQAEASKPSSSSPLSSSTNQKIATTKNVDASTAIIKKTTKPAPAKPASVAGTMKVKSTAKASPSYLLTSIEQIMTIPPNTLVELSGVVGSTPGMLAKHQFVLLAPNGRGLYVRASNKQPSPDFGTRVKIVGTLMHNDDGLYVRMGTNDRWSPDPGNTTVKIRASDLAELDLEDDWSLVQVTGYVVESSKTKALIDTGNGLVTINFSKLPQYRADRLNEQDQIRVMGLLNMGAPEFTLYPRDPEEIEILEHASLDAVEEPIANGLPGWVPFGAAGLTIAVTEGAKRLRKWRYELKIQKLMAKADK